MNEQNQKTKYVKVRLDEEEYTLLGNKARTAGMSRSEFIRTIIYHGNIEHHTNYSSEDAQKLLAELCRISNAMAHIEYSARLKLCVDEGEFLQLESIYRELFDIIGKHIL